VPASLVLAVFPSWAFFPAGKASGGIVVIAAAGAALEHMSTAVFAAANSKERSALCTRVGRLNACPGDIYSDLALRCARAHLRFFSAPNLHALC
jgi:hypothetical protein